MSQDPNRKTSSSGMYEQQERIKRISQNVVRRQAQKQLQKMIKNQINKQVFKASLKKFAKQAIANFFKAVMKMLINVLVKVIGSIVGFLGIFGFAAVCLGIIIIIVAFLVWDINFDGKSDVDTIKVEFEQVSQLTIDKSKVEQLEWKVPTGLIGAIVQISQLSKNSTVVDEVIPEIVGGKIPPQFIPIYKAAEEKYGTPWNILAAIHYKETTFSTSNKMVSSVGAIGHMQFMPATWVGWKYAIDRVGNVNPLLDLTSLSVIKNGSGYGVDGDGDGRADPWNLTDSIFTASNYLAKNNVRSNPYGAIYNYNHSDQYVNSVLAIAQGYLQIKEDPIEEEKTILVKPEVVSSVLLSGDTPYVTFAKQASKGLEPNFHYEKFETKKWQYKVTKVPDGKGGYITRKTEPRVVDTTQHNKIVSVDTWRGIYTLEWAITPTEYKLVSDDGETKVFEMEEEINEINRVYSSNYIRLLAKLKELKMGNNDKKIFYILYNTQVDSNSPEYTNRLPISTTGTNDHDLEGVIDTSPVDNLLPELLMKDKIWPVPSISRISSGFGRRDGTFHKGIDISNGHSGHTPIYAMADGLVIHAGPRNPKGFAQAIYIYHGNGLYSVYGHLQYNGYGVKTGDKVKKGQFIGKIGDGIVGASSGPHLHFEVIINGHHSSSATINGKRIDPLTVVRPN